MFPWSLGSAARRLAAATRASASASVLAARSSASAERQDSPPPDDDCEEPRQGEGVCEDVPWPHRRAGGQRHHRLIIEVSAAKRPLIYYSLSTAPHRPGLGISVTSPSSPPQSSHHLGAPVKASLGHRRASASPSLKCPRPPRPLRRALVPNNHPHPHHHMAPGLLQPCRHLAPAPSAADSGRSRGTVSIGDSRARSVALRAGGPGRTKASKDHSGLTRQLLDYQHDTVNEADGDYDAFGNMKARFMDFKQRNYVENFSKYQDLAEQQTPEFMVVACADSRVCPTSILGLQPGDAFTVRNIANLVPPYEHGASETTAALEFAVNTLKVPNVLVVGHSRCGGIQALMSMKNKKDDSGPGFIRGWVSLGKSARLSTEAAAGNLNFESQCRHCEKESINSSLLNLLTYPWIEERVMEGTLNLHAGYYNFIDCTFEKWTLVYRPGLEGGSKYAIKNRSTWS